ncbi:MAG: hypothetical protein V4683_10420 [Bacteroidota bacterium]
MKTRTFMAAAIILATFGSVSAKSIEFKTKEDPNVNFSIIQMDKLRFKINIPAIKEVVAFIKISDDSGNIIYSENTDLFSISKKLYDLSNLTDGTYTFTLKSGKEYETKSVLIKTQINRSALVAMN